MTFQQRTALVLSLLLIQVTVLPAAAQRFGQWWWEARVEAAERSYDDIVESGEGTRSSGTFGQSDLKLSLGLNGYILHPAVGRFRLGADLMLSEIDGGRLRDADRVGLRADVHLLPRSSFPVRVFFDRALFDYTTVSEEDPFTLLGVPDTTDHWGARVRLKSGPLRGTQLGIDAVDTDFLAPETNDESQDLQFIDWSRAGQRFKHRVRAERRDRSFGTLDLDIEEISLNFGEAGDLAPSWQWQMNGFSFLREQILADGPTLDTDSYRVSNRVTHPVRGTDLLDIQHVLGIFNIEDSSTDNQELTVFYRWRPRQGLEVAPFGRFGYRTAEASSVTAPEAGFLVSWSRQHGKLDSLVVGRASYRTEQRNRGEDSGDESQMALGFAGSLAHGSLRGLRKEIEAEIRHNELRFDIEPFLVLPDLGLPRGGLRSEDFGRARISLGHRWDSKSLDAYGEWSRREALNELNATDFTAETLSANVGLVARRFSLRGTAGETNVFQEVLGEPSDQQVRFTSFAATWRPFRYLSLRGSWRSDLRQLPLVTDLESERVEGGVEIRIGQIVLRGSAFESRQQLEQGPERINRGIVWSISRRFRGWLPIVSSVERRGVIR